MKATSCAWDTGDPLPSAASAVVMIEDVIEEGGLVSLYGERHTMAVRAQDRRGHQRGRYDPALLFPITSACMGAMLAAGVMTGRGHTLAGSGIIPTGNEIVPPPRTPAAGDFIEFKLDHLLRHADEWAAAEGTIPS
jgi:molybdopterin biosynthesis enzyme